VKAQKGQGEGRETKAEGEAGSVEGKTSYSAPVMKKNNMAHLQITSTPHFPPYPLHLPYFLYPIHTFSRRIGKGRYGAGVDILNSNTFCVYTLHKSVFSSCIGTKLSHTGLCVRKNTLAWNSHH